MDRTLISILYEAAPQLLAISPDFESELNRENENAIQNLALLDDLEHMTQQSFKESLKPCVKESQESKPAPDSKTPPPSSARPQPTRDAALLEALLELRNSNRFRQRPLGNYSPIIRPTQD